MFHTAIFYDKTDKLKLTDIWISNVQIKVDRFNNRIFNFRNGFSYLSPTRFICKKCFQEAVCFFEIPGFANMDVKLISVEIEEKRIVCKKRLLCVKNTKAKTYEIDISGNKDTDI